LEALTVRLNQARAIQWEKAPARHDKPRNDTSERSIGAPPSDPTADVVLDQDRLAVRQAVTAAETFLRRVEIGATTIAEQLQRSIDAWEGTSSIT